MCRSPVQPNTYHQQPLLAGEIVDTFTVISSKTNNNKKKVLKKSTLSEAEKNKIKVLIAH